MQKLIVSMMRLSTAVTLFTMEQMQNAVSVTTGTEDLGKSIDRFRTALDSVTDAVVKEMEKGKKETLDSVARMSEDLVRRSMETMNVSMLDPREMVRTTTDLMKKTSDSMADWMAGEEESAAKNVPKKVSDALSEDKTKSKKN